MECQSIKWTVMTAHRVEPSLQVVYGGQGSVPLLSPFKKEAVVRSIVADSLELEHHRIISKNHLLAWAAPSQ